MKPPLSFATALLTAGMLMVTLSNGQGRDAGHDSRGRLTGTWRLVWLEEQGADGEVHKADCSGLLVCTRDGHMSVQVMYRNVGESRSAAPAQYAQGGYEASFGRYEMDGAHTFTFHVEGALVRTLVGKDLKRVYEISGKQLIVKSTDPNEHWRVAWEYY